MAVVATMNSSDVDERKKNIIIEEEVDIDEEEEEEEPVVMSTSTSVINQHQHHHHHHHHQHQQQQQPEDDNHHQGVDEEAEAVMPGFRFHPTEEELVEFYLRRKVEGKRFQVELITFLDLYRYDPWELPAMAAIGEKEWFFYVPRDRKYRNGDRPNRVTTSGYWKATGADRLIRTENFRSIGLKKTLVFYSGKAPKGIRTSWIMNEYRLPQHETQRHQKAEISLCRVYKRAGVDDHHHPQLPRMLPSRSSPSSSSGGTTTMQEQQAFHNKYMKQQQRQQGNSSASGAAPSCQQFYYGGLHQQIAANMEPLTGAATAAGVGAAATTPLGTAADSITVSPFQVAAYFAAGSGSSGSSSACVNSSLVLLDDDLQRVVNYQQQAAAASSMMMNIHHFNQQQQQQQQQHIFSGWPLPPPPLAQQLQSLTATPPSTAAISNRLLWEWNQVPGDHTNTSSSSDYSANPPFK